MLKLSVKDGQYIDIGNDIRIIFTGHDGRQQGILIDAPSDVKIIRSDAKVRVGKPVEKYMSDKELGKERRYTPTQKKRIRNKG